MILKNKNTGLEIPLTTEQATVYLQRHGKMFEVVEATEDEENELRRKIEAEQTTPVEDKIMGGAVKDEITRERLVEIALDFNIKHNKLLGREKLETLVKDALVSLAKDVSIENPESLDIEALAKALSINGDDE